MNRFLLFLQYLQTGIHVQYSPLYGLYNCATVYNATFCSLSFTVESNYCAVIFSETCHVSPLCTSLTPIGSVTVSVTVSLLVSHVPPPPLVMIVVVAVQLRLGGGTKNANTA